jgi:hypothetical protein
MPAAVPRIWENQSCVIFGGGPSLTAVDVQYVITKGWKRVATNDAGLVLDPYADCLIAGDQRWWSWRHQEVAAQFKGKYIFAWKPVPATPGLNVIQLQHKTGIVSHDPRSVSACNTGQGAINIAYLFGASRILLLGYDMRVINGQHNWHKRHLKPTGEKRYKDVFSPAIEKAGKEIEKKGVTIINCTVNSALTCFPYQDIRTIL